MENSIKNTDVQHENIEHLAVNNTFLRRSLTLLALKTTAKFFPKNWPCRPISRTLIVKTGPFVHLHEAVTMKFVADNTSIPIPRVYCSFIHKNRAYIVMERIKGEALPNALNKLSDADRERVLLQLRNILQELRSLPPPPGTGVQNCLGGSLNDHRISHAKLDRFGPFKSIQSFHFWLRQGLRSEDCSAHVAGQGSITDQEWKEIEEMVTMQDGAWPEPVFTHADLNPSNILVYGNQVSGIIDWEFSGWYPHYWEYTSTWYAGLLSDEWHKTILKFLDPYPEELSMENTRKRWWGEF